MRKLTFGMNLSLDGYIAASGDDLGWSVPSDELFQWWSDRVGATGLAPYGRKLCHPRIPWPLGDRLATHADPANFLTQDTCARGRTGISLRCRTDRERDPALP